MSSSLLSGELQQAKLVLLGDMGAGKSSLVLRFVKGQFHDYQVKREEEEEGRNRWLTAGVLSLLALSLFSSLLERKTLACFAASKELEALYAVDRRKKRREQQQRGESDDASKGMNRCMAKNPRGKRRSVFFLLLSLITPPPLSSLAVPLSPRTRTPQNRSPRSAPRSLRSPCRTTASSSRSGKREMRRSSRGEKKKRRERGRGNERSVCRRNSSLSPPFSFPSVKSLHPHRQL